MTTRDHAPAGRAFIASVLAIVTGCSGAGARPSGAEHEEAGDPSACKGHVIDMPAAPVLLDRKGTLWTALYPNGTVFRDGRIVGRLDSSGCFHDELGRWVARWTSEGGLIEQEAISTFRLRDGTLEFLVDQTPYYVWTIQGNAIIEQRTDFMTDGPQAPRTAAMIVGEPDARTRELALRLVALQATRAKPSILRDSYSDLP